MPDGDASSPRLTRRWSSDVPDGPPPPASWPVPQAMQGATLVDRVVHQVTITDPMHPLAGCTLPLIHPLQVRSLPGRVVVRLLSGDHRAVDCTATDLTTPASSCRAPAASSSSISANILLSLAQQVHRLLNTVEERTNGPSSNCIQAAAGPDDAAQCRFTKPLARADSSPTATVGAGIGGIDPADAPVTWCWGGSSRIQTEPQIEWRWE
jgi:hypothetical protein